MGKIKLKNKKRSTKSRYSKTVVEYPKSTKVYDNMEKFHIEVTSNSLDNELNKLNKKFIIKTQVLEVIDDMWHIYLLTFPNDKKFVGNTRIKDEMNLKDQHENFIGTLLTTNKLWESEYSMTEIKQIKDELRSIILLGVYFEMTGGEYSEGDVNLSDVEL